MKQTFIVATLLFASVLSGCWDDSAEARARNEAFLIANSGPLIVASNAYIESGCTIVLKSPLREKWSGVSMNLYSVGECQKVPPNTTVEVSVIAEHPAYYIEGDRGRPGGWLVITGILKAQ